MARIRRRDLLTGSAAFLVGGRMARGEVISGKLPWQPDAGSAAHHTAWRLEVFHPRRSGDRGSAG